MGKATTSLSAEQSAWIAAQHLFFVASAPSSGGHVNCSPKGLDSFLVRDPHTVAWLDFVGSGAETIAHLRENGRICVLFCAFEGPPKILRLHGEGRVVEPQDPEFLELLARFPKRPAAALRALLVITLARVAESCGFGVPEMEFVGERSQMTAWAERKGEQGARDYQREKNVRSLDGLPALRWPEQDF
ncbi:MAG: pyridoxamine 5'-phosphate oxidase family protein [Planctomycetes bacterium]|nr:pyridoxamine 5'-phosphate oxidase family protein [Planctomycetota bacterium]